jgi:hypothetical protein
LEGILRKKELNSTSSTIDDAEVGPNFIHDSFESGGSKGAACPL